MFLSASIFYPSKGGKASVDIKVFMYTMIYSPKSVSIALFFYWYTFPPQPGLKILLHFFGLFSTIWDFYSAFFKQNLKMCIKKKLDGNALTVACNSRFKKSSHSKIKFSIWCCATVINSSLKSIFSLDTKRNQYLTSNDLIELDKRLYCRGWVRSGWANVLVEQWGIKGEVFSQNLTRHHKAAGH